MKAQNLDVNLPDINPYNIFYSTNNNQKLIFGSFYEYLNVIENSKETYS